MKKATNCYVKTVVNPFDNEDFDISGEIFIETEVKTNKKQISKRDKDGQLIEIIDEVEKTEVVSTIEKLTYKKKSKSRTLGSIAIFGSIFIGVVSFIGTVTGFLSDVPEAYKTVLSMLSSGG
ncbi:hypothetical protein [Photobacterium leiognathi]|uniref:hypothetical protein n=1 Tax=Photobacterium leiognathi TaxID=553611 RepID=UPI0029825831|nr:hypothetical protein [Photobacterium leiognathi]